jgi:hypothetical protein
VSVKHLLLVASLLLIGSNAASGQVLTGGRTTPARGSIEFGGGALWSPGFETGSETAQLTTSGQQPPFELFTADGEVSGFPGLHARLGFYISREISIEGGLRFSKPELSYRLSDDAESAPDETAAESISHYVFDGSVVFHFSGASFGNGRGVPFISGGGGYVRELHEGNELVETGNEIHVTGGVKYWLGTGRRRFGLRAEAGLSSREAGFDSSEGRRTLPIVLGGVTLLF